MKVLISAYACEPHRGSEPGAGWNWSIAAARDHEVWVLTRANNRNSIERELTQNPVPNLHFVFFDLPDWVKRWKKGKHGARWYYVLWQSGAFRVAKKLHGVQHFDVVHHLTFASMWLPTRIGRLDVPFVYGPVGGGVSVPLRLYPALGLRGILAEIQLESSRAIARLSPTLRRTWQAADLAIAQNEETARRLEAQVRAPVIVHPHASVGAGLPSKRQRDDRPRMRRAVCAGRLLPWKGVSLAIRAIAESESWSIEIIGEGPDEPRLRRLVRSLCVERQVSFTPWISQDELWAKLVTADALILPSLRDDAPLIVAEAVAVGLPVVALDQGGPAEMARRAVDAITLVPRSQAPGATATALAKALTNIACTGISAGRSVFSPQARSSTLQKWYSAVTTRTPQPTAPVTHTMPRA